MFRVSCIIFAAACKVKNLVAKRLLKDITVVPVIELQTVFGHNRCASVLYTLSDAFNVWWSC